MRAIIRYFLLLNLRIEFNAKKYDWVLIHTFCEMVDFSSTAFELKIDVRESMDNFFDFIKPTEIYPKHGNHENRM